MATSFWTIVIIKGLEDDKIRRTSCQKIKFVIYINKVTVSLFVCLSHLNQEVKLVFTLLQYLSVSNPCKMFLKIYIKLFCLWVAQYFVLTGIIHWHFSASIQTRMRWCLWHHWNSCLVYILLPSALLARIGHISSKEQCTGLQINHSNPESEDMLYYDH